MSRDKPDLEALFHSLWKNPPAEALRGARHLPADSPAGAPSSKSPAHTLLPEDVRSPGGTEETALISRSFAELDVTLMITPPEGDGLWTVRGRAWRRDDSNLPLTVLLIQTENVLGQVRVDNGASFTFQDLLGNAWALEFHLGPDRAVIIRGTSP